MEKEAFSVFSIFFAFSTIVWHTRSHIRLILLTQIDHINHGAGSWIQDSKVHTYFICIFLSLGLISCFTNNTLLYGGAHDLTEFPWTTVSHTNLSFKTVNGRFFFFFFSLYSFEIQNLLRWNVCVYLLNSFLLLVTVVVFFSIRSLFSLIHKCLH